MKARYQANLAAVMYSPNLGDGVIAECYSSVASQAGSDVRWLDLAGRTDFAPAKMSMRTHALTVLNALPRGLSDQIASMLVSKQISNRLVPLAEDVMKDAQGVVIGGGQLFADANMNFPMKIGKVVEIAAGRGLPIAIHAVGVAAKWSPPAQAYFRAALGAQSLCYISVRDHRSRDNLAAHIQSFGLKAPEIQIYPDPGFLASKAVPACPEGTEIGIGVTHPAALRNHGASNIRDTAQSFAARFIALGKQLHAAGDRVAFFTNGSPEDEVCLEHVRRLLAPQNGMRVVDRPQTPKKLMQLISGFKAVVSHRMHASIVAYSYGIPFVGMSWDPKLEGVFDLMDRRPFLIDGDMQDLQMVVKTIQSSIETSIDLQHHARLLSETDEGVRASLTALARASG